MLLVEYYFHVPGEGGRASAVRELPRGRGEMHARFTEDTLFLSLSLDGPWFVTRPGAAALHTLRDREIL